MSDEEDDYMSLKFLEGAEEFESKRQESYSERRKRQLREQQEKAYIKPRAQLEAEEREKGLQKTIDEGNKGMKMLMKMGFKKGQGLGRGNGIAEPIKVDMKAGRLGLGMDSEIRKREREEEEEEMRKRVNIDPEDYRAAMATRAKEAQLVRYLNAAVSICEKLDEDNEVKSNILWILKPIQPQQEEEEEEEGAEKVKVEVEKEAAIEEIQISTTESDETKEETEPLYPQEQVERLKSLPLSEQLESVIAYLREKYYYCFWCRAKYTDKQDLDDNCPGTEEEDH